MFSNDSFWCVTSSEKGIFHQRLQLEKEKRRDKKKRENQHNKGEAESTPAAKVVNRTEDETITSKNHIKVFH